MKILENKNNMVILENGEQAYFISYETTIAKYDYITRNLQLNVNYWDYSQTTLKQLKHFINNYTCYNYETKKDFEYKIEEIENIKFVENI